MRAGGLFDALPQDAAEEQVSTLLQGAGFVLERIVSTGQASPPGFWYDQERAEWVLLLRGSAGLELEGEAAPRTLHPGDWVHLPAHARHRVAWTDPAEPTVWLALHHDEPG